MRRIGLYGGSFDPIHFGHLIAARATAEALHLEGVIFLPSATPPHKSSENLAPAHHRASMVKLAIEGESGFSFSEADLHGDGPSYTIDTVSRFQNEFGPGVELHWVIGADSLSELTTWRRAAELVDLCHIVTAVRPGWDEVSWDAIQAALGPERTARLQAGLVATPAIDISSTDIRRRIREGRSIRYLVPESVRVYLDSQGLYRDFA